MKILSKPDGCIARPQGLSKFPGHWSAGSHLFVRRAKMGDALELLVPAVDASRARLTLHATKSHDYGSLRFSVNGQAAGVDVDLYAARPIPSDPIELGIFLPIDGGYRLRAEVVGKNPQSRDTYFGLDCVIVDSAKARQSR
jgi:hypothetical protein